MNYQGDYKIFDTHAVKTYPIASRPNRITCDDVLSPERTHIQDFALPDQQQENIRTVAEHVIRMRNEKKPVVLFAGAHLIKNGLGRLLIGIFINN